MILRNLPVEHLIDRTRSSLICCWSTNCDKIEEFIKNDLFREMELSIFNHLVLVESMLRLSYPSKYKIFDQFTFYNLISDVNIDEEI